MSINLGEVPSTPGIYKFFSKNKIIYIGKAKNLKKRVSSYFRNSVSDRKTYQIKTLTDRLETFSTSSEVEALLLEQSLIKENLPKFNILLRDDKSYPYVHFSMEHSFPSVTMKRTKHAVSKNFFGPYVSSQAVKSTIKDLQKIFQIRNCAESTFKNRSRPCIEYQMKRCSAPCVNYINQNDYLYDVESSQEYLSSSGKRTKALMKARMKKLAKEQEFEKANEMKKRIHNLDMLHQEQSFNSGLMSVDFFTAISKLGRTGVSIISVRDGKIRGAKTHYILGNLIEDSDSLFQNLIFSHYQNIFSLPDKIFFNIRPNNKELIKKAIKLKFNKNVLITSNNTAASRKISKLGLLNANQVINNKLNQVEKYSFGINDLAQRLGLSSSKFSVEGYDISHQSGKFAVAALVKFLATGPQKSDYKLFNIPSELAGNDIGSIKHVLERRINRIKEDPLPKVILIDGGILQLNAAIEIFNTHNIKSTTILSIAKGSKRVRATETIFSKAGIVEMPKDCAAFNFIQQVRDESHRFAIRSNRNKKNKSIQFSALNYINGIGPIKKKALLDHFKSIKSIRSAKINELCMVDGISIKIANEIKKSL
jgi:excinuclease ABC subunit C